MFYGVFDCVWVVLFETELHWLQYMFFLWFEYVWKMLLRLLGGYKESYSIIFAYLWRCDSNDKEDMTVRNSQSFCQTVCEVLILDHLESACIPDDTYHDDREIYFVSSFRWTDCEHPHDSRTTILPRRDWLLSYWLSNFHLPPSPKKQIKQTIASKTTLHRFLERLHIETRHQLGDFLGSSLEPQRGTGRAAPGDGWKCLGRGGLRCLLRRWLTLVLLVDFFKLILAILVGSPREVISKSVLASWEVFAHILGPNHI